VAGGRIRRNGGPRPSKVSSRSHRARPTAIEPRPSTLAGPTRHNASVWALGTDGAGAARPAGLLAGLGPFFAVETHRPGEAAPAPWQPLGTLLGSATALAARIDAVRDRLAAAAGCPASQIERRVAASVTRLGIAARLISPVLGSAVLGVPLGIDVAQARWVPALGGPFRLSLAVPDGPARPHGAAPAEACLPLNELLAGPVRALVDLTAPVVSRRVLWGNVGSAINGAAVMISTSQPPLHRRAIQVSTAALGFPELADGYRGQPTTSFQRKSCCLIYRLAGSPQYCGDCILNGR
jgi:FhuF 2Fe-2S C-terminal domain